MGEVEQELRAKIGSTGEIGTTFGGFEVTVLKEELFPWREVLEYLLDHQREVWVRRSQGRLVIISKP